MAHLRSILIAHIIAVFVGVAFSVPAEAAVLGFSGFGHAAKNKHGFSPPHRNDNRRHSFSFTAHEDWRFSSGHHGRGHHFDFGDHGRHIGRGFLLAAAHFAHHHDFRFRHLFSRSRFGDDCDDPPNVSHAPLPAALPMFGVGLAGLLGFGRFRTRRDRPA